MNEIVPVQDSQGVGVGGLIPIQQQGDTLVVDARTLHTFLEVETRFNDWIARRLADALATEGEDFYSTLRKTSGRPSAEYLITLDLAKELAMLERTERGREIRRYFIDAEKQLRAGPMALPTSLSEALRLAADLAEQRERLAAENALLAPKAQVYDALISSDGTYAVGDAAKILGTGEVRLFAQLRERNILMDRQRSGAEHHNLPYQQYIERGYFTVITRPRPGSDTGKVSQTTRVTAKGLAWLQKGLQQQNLLLAERPA